MKEVIESIRLPTKHSYTDVPGQSYSGSGSWTKPWTRRSKGRSSRKARVKFESLQHLNEVTLPWSMRMGDTASWTAAITEGRAGLDRPVRRLEPMVKAAPVWRIRTSARNSWSVMSTKLPKIQEFVQADENLWE